MSTQKELTVKIKGIRPLLLHNGDLANPMGEASKQMKKASSKRGKVDEDYELLSNIEFKYGLYFDAELGVYMPSENLMAMFIAGAKRIKQKAKVSAILVDHELGASIIWDDRKHDDFEELMNEPKLRFIKMVRVMTNRVLRTRPKIPSGWTITFNVLLDTATMDEDSLSQILTVAGKTVGLGDWRPNCPAPGTFGMFILESINKR